MKNIALALFATLLLASCEEAPLPEEKSPCGEQMADKTVEMALRALEAAHTTPGRGSSHLRLLDDADLNIGNAVVVPPLPDFPATAFDFAPPGVLGATRILNLNGESSKGGMVTLALAAQLAPLPQPNQGVAANAPNQITGIIEFGNGGVFDTVEVDIPLGFFQIPMGTGSFVVPNPNSNFDGGTILSVPAGSLRVYARNDSHLIEPPLLSSAPLLANFPAGTSFPNQPAPNWFGPNSSAALAALVKAQACYSTRFSSRSPTRTLTILHTLNFVATLAGQVWRIPPFARTLRVVRFNPGAAVSQPAVTVDFQSAAGTNVEEISIPAGTPSPIIEISGQAHTVTLSTVIGTAITEAIVQLIYEIEI